ncbi:MAG TPA: VCBS repeat-containing protein [Planctomycetota bacterium]|jgi:hypothetical protein|nr:VCBS repeat-containing protein [Planctomycetota bacterium]
MTGLLLPLLLLPPTPGKAETQRVVVEPKVVGHAEADVDGDGRCDLLLALVPEKAGEDRAIALFLQKPGGKFAAAPDLRIPVKKDVLAWSVGDLLPEPGREILFLTRSAAFAFVPRGAEYRENVRRIASFESLFEAPSPSELPRWPHLLDVDGDGLPELFVPERDRIRAFGRDPARPEGEWLDRGSVPARRDRDEGRGPRNGVRRRGRQVTLSLGVGGPEVGYTNDPFLVGPGPEPERGDLASTSSSLHIPVLADATGDGRADVYLLAGGWIRIHAQDASGRFPEEPTWKGRLRKEDGWPDEVRVRDLDGDGRAEILPLGSAKGGLLSGDQALEVIRGGDPGPALETAAARYKFDGYGLYVECVDVDGDGVLDLALSVLDVPATPETIATGTRIRWAYHVFRGARGRGAERESALRFVEEWEPAAIAGMGMIATFGGDADGDGIADFLRVAPDGRFGAYRLLRAKGGKLEKEETPLFEVPIDRAAKDLAVLRLDEDAKADAVVFHDDGFTTVFPR